MEQLVQDFRLGVRQLRRNPAYALAAILTMALGIGANAAIFSVAWQAILKPLPYPKSSQLVEIWEINKNGQHNLSLPAKFHDVQREARSFSKVAAFGAIGGSADLTGAGEPEQLSVLRVTGSFFDVFGMAPLLGRALQQADFTSDENAVVISQDLWERRFARGAGVIGATVRLDGAPGQIVGVMPAEFGVSGGRVDLWVPMGLPPPTLRKTGHFLRVVARLRDDVSVQVADAEVNAIASRAAALYPATDGLLSQTAQPIGEGRTDSATRASLLTLALAAAAVWLMACANLGGLQLARGVARSQEFGVRAALGASRGRVMAQLLAEGLSVSLAGAAAGLVVGMWVLKGLKTIAPAAVAPSVTPHPDLPVVLFSLGLGLASAVVFSLAPAWRAADTASHWLRQRGTDGDRKTARTRSGLVVAQVASAFALIVGATFLMTSLYNIRGVDPGFRSDGVLAFDVTAPMNRELQRDRFAEGAAFFRAVAAEVGAIPGVTSVCATNELPFDPQFNMTYVPDGATSPVGAFPRTVTPDCFTTFGIAIKRGRGFSTNESSRVAIVTETFAARAWPDQNPIGQRLHEGVAEGALIEVVGVAADTREMSLERRPYPVVYEAWTEKASFPPQRVAVRTAMPPASLFPAVKSAVRRAAPDQPVARLRALSDMVDRSLAGRRFNLMLLGSFAGVALLLAVVGVYGLLSQIVAQRTREIGVRLALGATTGSVVRLMLVQAGTALAIGLPIGLGAAIGGARMLQQFFFGVSVSNVGVYAGVAALLAISVVVAGWLPARRAAHVDPSSSVRS